MHLEESFLKILADYAQHTAPILLVVLNEDGIIEQANEYTEQVAGTGVVGTLFAEMLVDFHKSFTVDLTRRERADPLLLNITGRSGLPQTFYFRFFFSGDKILGLGHQDPAETEAMRQNLVGLNNEFSNLTRELHKKNAELHNAMEKIKVLRGIIPICCHCKQIRDDKGYWNQLENYIQTHSEAIFSHGICDTCLEKYYPEEAADEN